MKWYWNPKGIKKHHPDVVGLAHHEECFHYEGKKFWKKPGIESLPTSVVRIMFNSDQKDHICVRCSKALA